MCVCVHTHTHMHTQLYTYAHTYIHINTHAHSHAQSHINPLNAKIVAANLSCSAKVVFVKEKRWLCQGIDAPCNALVSVLRLYFLFCIGYLPLLHSFYIHKYNIVRSVDGKSYGRRRRFARASSTCSSYVPYSFVVAWASARYVPSFDIVAYT